MASTGISRRSLLRGAVSAAGALAASAVLAACGGGAAPAATVTKPVGGATSAPATTTGASAATSAPAGSSAAGGASTPLTGAGIGGAQPTLAPTTVGALTNPATFQPPKIKASKPTTLSLWHYNGFHVDVQKFIAEEYKKRFDPNVSLEVTAYPGLNEQRTAVKAAIAAGSGTPDIIAVEPGAYCVDVYTSKGVTGFNQTFKDDPEFQKGFWPNALSLLTVNGETVSVPLVTNTVVVYYNKKLFAQNNAQVPETLDDLKKLAPIFNGKGIAPMVVTWGQDRNAPVFPFYTTAGGLQVDKLMRDADLGKAPWNGPELMEAAGIAESIVRSDLIIKGAVGIKEPDAISVFSTGKAAMFWGGQWLRTSLRQALPPDFDLGLFAFPSVKSGGPKPVLSSVGMTLTVNSKGKNPEIAYEMVKAITGAWGKIEYSKALGISPNGPISADAIAYQLQALKDPLYPEFLKLQPTGTTRVLFTPQVEEAMYQSMQAMIAGQKTAKQAMDDVESASKQAGERKFAVG